MTLAFLADNDIMTFKSSHLSILNADTTLIDSYLDSLNVLAGDICYAASIYLRGDTCGNAPAATAYQTLRLEVSDKLNRAISARANLTQLIADLTATTSQNDLAVLNFQSRLIEYVRDKALVSTIGVDELYNRAYNVLLAHSRTTACFGTGYTTPLTSEYADVGNTTCLHYKREAARTADAMIGDAYKRSQSLTQRIEATQSFVNWWVDQSPTAKCTLAYGALLNSLKQLLEAYTNMMDSLNSLLQQISEIDCNASDWALQIAAAQSILDGLTTLKAGYDATDTREDLLADQIAAMCTINGKANASSVKAVDPPASNPIFN